MLYFSPQLLSATAILYILDIFLSFLHFTANMKTAPFISLGITWVDNCAVVFTETIIKKIQTEQNFNLKVGISIHKSITGASMQ